MQIGIIMNILFVVSALTNGGAERVCVSVANGLSRLGHNVTILTGVSGNFDYQLDDRVDKVVIYQSTSNLLYRIYRRFMRVPIFCYTLFCILRNKKIDIVINVLAFHFLETIIISRIMGRKVIFSDHNTYERPKEEPMPFKSKIHKYIYALLCNYTTVLTKRDRDLLTKRKNIIVMHNPLFLKPLDYVPSKKKVILAVGRLDSWYYKGFDLLINSWGNICNKFPEWQLRIVGNGSERAINKLKELINEARAKRINLIPFKKDIECEYRDASIFVLSSRYEGFGLVLIEAMSQRCACIACDYLTRQSEIITDGVDGLLCSVDDLSALENKILQLLEDEQLRLSLQEHSTDNVERFSEYNVALHWESLIMKVYNNV